MKKKGYKMMRLGMIIGLLCLGIGRLSAQTLSGKVVDSESLPVGYATVVVLSDSVLVQGGISDEDGLFHISGLEGGSGKQYLLKVSCIGYGTVCRQCSAGKIGTVVLPSDNVMLDDVLVTGHLPQHKLQNGGLVTKVGNSVLSKVGTAQNILAHIPGVLKKQDGSFEVLGKGAPLIYIDGRQVRDLSELNRLGSDAVKQVELLTNPGARYDASVGAVLKISTDGKKENGWGVDARSGISYFYKTGLEEQVDVNYRHRSLDVFGTFRYELSHHKETGSSYQMTYLDTLWQQSTRSLDLGKTNSYFGKIGFNYEINKNHSLGATYEITAMPHIRMTNDNFSDVYADQMFYDQWHTFSDSKESAGPTIHVNGYYNGNAGRLNIDLNADMMMGNNKEDEEVNEKSLKDKDTWLGLISRSKNRLYAGRLVLAYPLAGGMLSGGSEYTYAHKTDNFMDNGLVLESTDDKIKEQNLAFFLDYRHTFGKVDGTVGLRYEHVNYDFYEEAILRPEASKIYNNFFPSLSLSVPTGSVQWNLSYNVKTRRPAYEMLKNSVHYGNRFTYLSGNPQLQPTYIHTVELRGSYKALQAAVGYNYYKDDIMFLSTQYEADPKISVISFCNADRRDGVTASLVYAPHYGIWKPQWMAVAQTQWFDVEYREENKKMDGTIFHLSWNNAFELPCGYLLRIDGNYNSQGKMQNNKIGASSSMDVSLFKSFCKGRLDILLEGNDLFHTQRDKCLQYNPWTDLQRTTKDNTRGVKLTAHYHFNVKKSKYKGTGAGQSEMRRF